LSPATCAAASVHYIHVMPLSYESLRAELDGIVERYRAPDGSRVGLTREEAVKRIRRLGFSEGDAERWLGSKPRSTSPKIAAAPRSNRLI
jgi:hypothetical protein